MQTLYYKLEYGCFYCKSATQIQYDYALYSVDCKVWRVSGSVTNRDLDDTTKYGIHTDKRIYEH